MLNDLDAFFAFLSDHDAMVAMINSLGPFGPLLYIGLQVLQTVLAPIPGNVVGGIGGYLFGWWGVLWTTIGACIGAAIVFYVSRKLGRRIIERFVKKSTLEKFDFITRDKRAAAVLFAIYLIPGLPDDIVCYVAGLTKVPIKKLVFLFAVGRLPAVIVNNYIGMGLGDGDLSLVIVLIVVSALVAGLFYWKQDAIISWLKKFR